jgi:uncharacterized RDD family membrane protein YckC
MAIQFACPWCIQTISVDDGKARERIECPNCNRPVKVPTKSTHDLPPPLPLPSQNVEDPTPSIASLIPGGAGFGIRFLARFIDDLLYGWMLGLIVGAVAGMVFVVLVYLGKLTPAELQAILFAAHFRETHLGLTFMGVGLGILGTSLYHIVAEGFSTVTIGKLICGLRVVQVDGRPASMKGALVRQLGYWVDALFFGLIGYSSMQKGPLRQRYGDVWGKTVVVKASVFQSQPARGFGRMFAGILMGSALWAGIFCLGQISASDMRLKPGRGANGEQTRPSNLTQYVNTRSCVPGSRPEAILNPIR